MCCNGVIFADVKFREEDKARRFQLRGLKVVARKGAPPQQGSPPSSPAQGVSTTFQLPQPCPAFDGTRCLVYAQRPDHCRRFECFLMKEVKAGRVSGAVALRRIAAARAAAGRVEVLLEALGNRQENRPLAVRFRQSLKWLETGKAGPEALALGSQLTLAMHRLNLLLNRWFYPGS